MRVLTVFLSLLFSLVACAQESKPAKEPVPEPPKIENSSVDKSSVTKKVQAPVVTTAGSVYEEGKHYTVIKTPVRTITPGKIEVSEVFWYGCSHCFSFEPSLEAWSKVAPADVALIKVPAIWRDVMNLHARMYFAVENLGLYKKANMKIFEAMNTGSKKKFSNENEIAEYMTQFGVTKEEFLKVFNSFSVKSQAQQADSRARGFGISSTPSMVVNGKYLVSPRSAGSHEDMLKVVNYLVDKERPTLKK